MFSSLFTLCVCAAVAAAQPYLTGETGRRIGSNQHSQSATLNGPLTVQDVAVWEKLRRFNTERIPERVVHARGAAATGKFTSSVDLSKLTRSSIFSGPGRMTDVVVRFSTVIHGKHSPETLRDPRGFAIKFKSADGNWDLVGNNLPVFFIRDHIKFPDMVHSLKPDPVTNIQDPNRFFDFFAAMGGMATNMLTYLYSDLGIPKSYRFMQGNSVHAYKLVNATGHVTYAKFRWFPVQGEANLTRAEAAAIQANDFNHATRDLVDAIGNGDFPQWDLRVQTMSPADLTKQEFNALDATKIWPEKRFPFMSLGTLELNAIPGNFHTGSEQSAFCPANFINGAIEPSEDRLLQGRLISYHESQVHRHGSPLFQHLPINAAAVPVRNYNQDGVMVREQTFNGSVNYEPSVGTDTYKEDESALLSTRRLCGATVQESIKKTLNFQQAGILWRSFSDMDKTNLIGNLAADLGMVKSQTVRNMMCSHFFKADQFYGRRIAKAVGCNVPDVMKLADDLM